VTASPQGPPQPADPTQPTVEPLGNVVRRVVVVMLVAVVLYGAIVLYRGIADVGARFRGYAWWTLGAACGLAFANYLLRFLKWEYYLRLLAIRGVPKIESFLTFLSGFVLTVTPGKIGEVFKSLVLFKTRGVPIEHSAPIVVAERVTDLIGVIAMISLGSLGFRGGLPWAIAGALVVVALLVTIAWPRLSNGLVGGLRRLPGAAGRLGGRLAPRLEAALGDLRQLTSPSRLVWPTLLSTVGWSLEGVGLWVILGGFGQRTPVTLAGFFYATATLAGALIPLPGGLGVTDKLLEEQLAGLGGVEPAAATAAMLLIRFATLWFAVVVGFAALGLLRMRHPGLRAQTAPPARPKQAPGRPRDDASPGPRANAENEET
jgi:glycosyltransferase 2 family protein